MVNQQNKCNKKQPSAVVVIILKMFLNQKRYGDGMIIHYNCTRLLLVALVLLIYHPYPPSFHEMIYIAIYTFSTNFSFVCCETGAPGRTKSANTAYTTHACALAQTAPLVPSQAIFCGGGKNGLLFAHSQKSGILRFFIVVFRYIPEYVQQRVR